MGHYSDDYEYEEEKRRKAHVKDVAKFKEKLRDLKTENTFYNLPQRFKDAFEDVDNWLTVEISKNK